MPGYGELSRFMGSRRDTEVFRRFSNMNIESLLHMQSELSALELSLNVMRKDPNWNSFDSSWLTPPQSSTNVVVGDMFERARVLLDRYQSALLRTAQINALEQAPQDSFELLQQWYDEENGGDNFLQGVEAAIFRDEQCRKDLLSLNKRPGREDPIAVFIADKIVPLYDRVLGWRLHQSMSASAFHDVREYHMRTMVVLGNLLCMLLSAVMPALAILVLYNIKSMVSRLVVIIFMSLLFSVVMTVIAQKKADIFMSTTAFAAVLVVFVGSSDVIKGQG